MTIRFLVTSVDEALLHQLLSLAGRPALALSAARPFTEKCVPFQIMSNQLHLPQVDSNHGVETSQQ